MKKIALIYWPKKGNTEKAAHIIAKQFTEESIDVFTIKEINTAEFALYDAFIIGAPTTGADSWEAAYKNQWNDFFIRLGKTGINEKPFAIFGLGDQILYPYNFVDGMIEIKKQFEKHGAVLKGNWSTEGYEFKDSESIEGEKFYGLALDEDQQAELTHERVAVWVKQVKEEFGF